MTDLFLSMIERSRTEQPKVTNPIQNVLALQTEDVTNAIISILATPPNVLVSNVVLNIILYS